MFVSQTIRGSAKPYLFVLIASVVAGKFSQYLWQYVWPDIPMIKGQSPGIWVLFVGFLISGILWLLYRGTRTTNPWIIAALAALAFAWIIHASLTRLHVDQTPYTTLLLPLALAALWLKTPSDTDFRGGLILLAWLLAGILVITRTAEIVGLIPMVDVGDPLIAFEQSNYWLPLQGWLGPEGRWPGPMGHNSQTGNVAAMILILALGLRGGWRWLLVLVAVVTLMLTSSKTSYLAVIVGVILLLILDDNPLTRRVKRTWLALGAGTLGLIAIAVVLVQNTNLTGRTDYWSLAFDAWSTSPLTGVGSDAMNSAQLSTMGTNAHNIFIDALLKYGAIGLIPVALLAAIILVITVKAAARNIVLPLALVSTYLVIGLAQADEGWLTPSVLWLWLTLATLWAASALAESRPPSQP